MREISDEKLRKYFSLTEKAISKVKIKEGLKVKERKAAEDFLDMAERYFSDAKHFRDKGDIVTAFAAVSYAHAWLDAGARLGLFDFGRDSYLFAAD
ncbi:MAG: DUF357 domain-containing protein [Bdellovibrio sp.]|nr:MAG: DUF357 domain-containing protein [Bdellovibrio sp.]